MSVTIIKARTQGRTSASLLKVKREIHDASLEAKDLLEDARLQAAQVIEEACQTEGEIRKAAFQQGYSEGLNHWNEMLCEARRLRQEYLARNEPELIRLAVAVASKIIRHEVQSDSSAICNTVREVLKSTGREKKLIIRVNPAEEAKVQSQIESLANGVHEIVVVGNREVSPGGCVVESEIGVVDAQLETQLAALEKNLLRRCHHACN